MDRRMDIHREKKRKHDDFDDLLSPAGKSRGKRLKQEILDDVNVDLLTLDDLPSSSMETPRRKRQNEHHDFGDLLLPSSNNILENGVGHSRNMVNTGRNVDDYNIWLVRKPVNVRFKNNEWYKNMHIRGNTGIRWLYFSVFLYSNNFCGYK